MGSTTLARALVIVIFLASLAQAQSNNKFGAGLFLGGSKLQGDINESNTGLTGGLLLRYVPTSRLGITASGTYGKMTSGLNAIDSYVHSFTLSGNFFIMPYNVFNPYLSVGVVSLRYNAYYGDGQQVFREDSTPNRGWDKGLILGGGFELTTSSYWSINAIGNYTLASGDALDGIMHGKNDGYFKALIGVVRYIGSNRTNDYDAGMQQLKRGLSVEEVRNEPKIANTLQTKRKTDKENAGAFTSGIFFEPGTAQLQARSKVQLDKIYNYLMENPEQEIELLGKATKKTVSINYSLVVERAQAVKDYLVERGVEPTRIMVSSRRVR